MRHFLPHVGFPRRLIARWLPWPALLLLAGAGCTGGCGGFPDDRPSVILVVIDTLRRDHLSLHGYARATSPGLDRLGQEAVIFERCLAPSSWTQPSTVSLLTGLYPARHGAHAFALVDPEIEFLAERLRGRGYATAGFSANPNASPLFGMDQGCDHFYFAGNAEAKEYPDLSVILAEAQKWLATRPPGPFFLYLQTMNVHGPYRSPPEARERFREEPCEPLPFQGELWNRVVRDPLSARGAVTPAHLRDLLARYDGAIAYTDALLREFFDSLGAEGLLDSSLVVVTSDHGEELLDHGGLGHGWTLHGEVIDVPLIFRPPGGSSPRRISEPVSLIDLPATILDRVGLLDSAAGGRFGDGRSLLPLLEGREGDVGVDRTLLTRPLLAQVRRSTNASFAVQRWPHRLVLIDADRHGPSPRRELYRVDVDPGEHDDLSSREPELVAELEKLARSVRRSLEARAFSASHPMLPEEVERRLEALGYKTESERPSRNGDFGREDGEN